MSSWHELITVLFQLVILPFVVCGPRGGGWLSVHIILTKSYFYIAFYKNGVVKICNFMMHDWVIKYITVTAANLVLSIQLPCVILGYFTARGNGNVHLTPH